MGHKVKIDEEFVEGATEKRRALMEDWAVRADAPIGVFDSGVGGLTVARAIIDQLPAEQLHYVGDTAHVPYGPRPIAEVRKFTLECLDRLADSGVKMLVIACNAASSACLRDARERYDIPVVEVIVPAVRRAVAATRNGKVGVIGTAVTVASRSYDDAFAAAPAISLHTVACPRFVDFVERGMTSGRQVLGLTQSYLEPLQVAGIDTLVLGCTHYPLLTGVLSLVMGDGVTLVNSAEETAKDVYRALTEADLLRSIESGPPRHVFTATGDAAPFVKLGRRFLGPEIEAIESVASSAG